MGGFPEEKGVGKVEKTGYGRIGSPRRDFRAENLEQLQPSEDRTMRLDTPIYANSMVGKTIGDIQGRYNIIVEALNEEKPELAHMIEYGNEIVVSGQMADILAFGKLTYK